MSSLSQRHRGAMRTTALVALLIAGSSTAFADAFDPPATYYDSTAPGGVPLVGSALKSALTTITNNAIFQDYGYARFALDDIDADLDNPGNVMLVYNGASVSGTWDSGSTWNREHTWPRSLGVGSSGADNSDLHQLRPCNPGLNSSRGNKPFGPGGSYWDPGAFGQYYRGEMARAMFYMETRYTYLTLVDGFPSGNQMGDLRYLLRWHYEEAPDFGERRRNQEIYDHHQSNRNPYVDRPEFVWTIWGDGPNDSTLHVGASPAADGSSSTTVDVGVGLVGAPFAPVDVTITKLGDDPTTFEVILAGDASSPDANNQGRFRYRRDINGVIELPVQQKTIGASLLATTAGAVNGTIFIDNTDLTEEAGASGEGKGARDTDDIITISGVALDRAEGSLASPADVDGITIDFGTVFQFGVEPVEPIVIHNLESTPGLTADLVIAALASSGDDAVLTTDVATSGTIVPGDSASFGATVDTDVAQGAYAATWTITVSDEALPGAQSEDLTVTLLAVVGPPACSGDIDGDGGTQLGDFTILASNFGAGPGALRSQGDLTGDGFVDLGDFTVLAGDFGCTP